MKATVVEAEIVEEITIEFDKNPLLSKEEWRIVSRALLAYPETPIRLKSVALVFLHEHRVEL
jgi:hypothetical protein